MTMNFPMIVKSNRNSLNIKFGSLKFTKMRAKEELKQRE